MLGRPSLRTFADSAKNSDVTALTRRRLLATAAVSGVLGTVVARTGGTSHDPTEAAGWRHPQATPGNTAAVDVAGPRSADDVAWRAIVDDTASYRRSGLALADETLLVPTHRSLLGYSRTGERRFTATVPSRNQFDDYTQLDSDPRVAGDRCFVASLASVHAIDVANGRTRWRYETNSSVDGLTLLGNSLFLLSFVGDAESVVAIDATSGRERWRTVGRYVPLAATSERLLVAAYRSGRLHSVDPATGNRQWGSELSVRWPSLRRGTVALTDDVCWLLREGRLTAVDPTTGDELWTEPLTERESTRSDRLAVGDGAYVVQPEAEELSAFTAAGEHRFTQTITDAAQGVALGSDTAYVATESGLEAVDREDGSSLFRVAPATEPGDAVTPLVTDDAVFHVAGDTLYGVTSS